MKVNGELEQKFTTPEKNPVISQECTERQEARNSGTNEAIEYLSKCGRLADIVAVEVLSGTNEKAMDILRMCGCDIFVPGTVYTSIDEISSFYGVTTQYTKTVLNRNRITTKTMSEDVLKEYFESFITEAGVRKQYTVGHRKDGWIFHNNKTNKQRLFKHNTRGNLYSARVVLAMAAMMRYGRQIWQNAKGSQVYDALMNSSYADVARAKHEERRVQRNRQRNEQMKQEKMQRENPASSPTGAVLNKDGTVVLTTEFFATVINTAIREGISEFAKVIQTSGSPPEATNTRMAMPENWDRISKYYAAGILTLPEAAALTKMSEESFAGFLQA